MGSGSAPAWLNSGSITALILFAVAIIGGGIGLLMLLRSNKADPGAQFRTGISSLIALIVIIAFVGGTAAVSIATGTLDFFINK